MSTEQEDKRAAARERLNEAIANGQVHPAVADFLAVLDDDVTGVRDRHDALTKDVAERERADREAREGTTDDTAGKVDGRTADTDPTPGSDKAPAETNTPAARREAAAGKNRSHS